jgi:hypothetical protein
MESSATAKPATKLEAGYPILIRIASKGVCADACAIV